MIGQNGMSSTLNAWLPSALLGTKVIDAVGDMRAHPTGDMGSIGMAASPEPTIQTAVGGHRASNSYIELVVRGATAKVSPVLRKAADHGRRLHRELPQSGTRILRQTECRAGRHLARARARRSDLRGRTEGRPRRY